MALFVSSPLASGDCLSQRRDGSHRGISLCKTERHQTALRGPAQTCSHARTATRAFSSFRGILTRRASETSPCRRAGDAKQRARPPQGDDEQPGRRRGNRDPRALGVWPGCLPRRLQLVCTRSSGRNSLFRRCGNRCCRNRGRTPLGSMGGCSGHRPGGQSNRGWGPTGAAARPRGVQAPEESLDQRGRRWVPQFGVQLPRPGQSFVMAFTNRLFAVLGDFTHAGTS